MCDNIIEPSEENEKEIHEIEKYLLSLVKPKSFSGKTRLKLNMRKVLKYFAT